MDNEVRASGFSKEIKEFDDILDEIEAEQQQQIGENEQEDEAPELVSSEFSSEHLVTRVIDTSLGACSDPNSGLDNTKEINDCDQSYADELADKFDSDLLVSANNNKVFYYCWFDLYLNLVMIQIAFNFNLKGV